MPYIKKEFRSVLESNCHLEELLAGLGRLSPTVGDLNYLITRICHEYIKIHGMSYQASNDLVGVLDCAKMELYRRVISKYEDKKIKENGDV
jgi:hypothetical protein